MVFKEVLNTLLRITKKIKHVVWCKMFCYTIQQKKREEQEENSISKNKVLLHFQLIELNKHKCLEVSELEGPGVPIFSYMDYTYHQNQKGQQIWIIFFFIINRAPRIKIKFGVTLQRTERKLEKRIIWFLPMPLENSHIWDISFTKTKSHAWNIILGKAWYKMVFVYHHFSICCWFHVNFLWLNRI